MSGEADTITYEVLLFSVLKQRVGAPAVTVDACKGITGADLLNRLSERYPAMAPYRKVIRLAVNREYVSEDIVLAPGDEIALITPVSGG